MSDNSSIEWTDATWNVVTGCVEVSPGCDNCYAKTFAERWRGVPGHHFEQGFDVVLRPERLDLPLRWKKPRRVFVNSMSDLFHEAVPDEFIARTFAVMARAPQHTFQVLTKRHARMRSLIGGIDGSGHRLLEAAVDEETAQALYDQWPLPNVWLGVSVEDQKWADIRIPALLDTPAAVRWLSCEPLLGPLDLNRWLADPHFNPAYRVARCGQQSAHSRHVMEHGPDQPRNCPGTGGGTFWSRRLDWIVCGGESGPGSRPMHPDWARGLRDQCTSASVPYFHKQNGQYAPVTDRPAEGDVWVSRADGGAVEWRSYDGHIREAGGDFRSPGGRSVLVRRARSKHDAGRLLDGREWNEYPQARQVSGV